jgi:hypothetical protein
MLRDENSFDIYIYIYIYNLAYRIIVMVKIS